MTGLNNLFHLIVENWATIVALVGCILVAINRFKSFLSLSKDEQKEAALKIVKEELLKLMSESEINWSEVKKSGEIKRSEVIAEIYDKFPVLSEFEDQETLLKEINTMIDDTKVVMDRILNGDNN